MRPIKLTMTAFGAYAGETTIDFRELGHRSLLLIHGPTGSGKTTILDAVCFGLFGETSGGDREAGQMRSHLAGGKDLLSVQFDFALGGDAFRVFRRPAQQVEGRKTATKPEAVLSRRTGLTDDVVEGSVEASGWRDVTEAVIRKIGFDEKQFRQVIMLPQGQFRKLLSSDSKERQDILERLFQTEIYRRIEEALKEARNRLKREADELKAKQELILGQAGVESGEALEDKRRSNLDELTRIQTDLEALRKKEQTARAVLEAARADDAKLKEKAAADGAVQALENQRPEMETTRRTLDRGRAAAGVRPLEQQVAVRQAEWRTAQELHDGRKIAADDARKKLDAAARTLNTEQGREPERIALRRRIADLEPIEPRLAEVDRLRAQAAQADEAAQRSRDGLARIQRNSESLKSGIEVAQRNRQEAELSAGRVEALKPALDQVNKKVNWRQELDRKNRELFAVQRRLEDAVARSSDAEKILLIAKSTLASLETAWRDGQAARLAMSLESGQPCPVCGSTSHPAPAHSEAEVPTDERIDRQKAEVVRSEKELGRLQKLEADQDKQAGVLQSAVNQLAENLGDAVHRTSDDLKLESEKTARELRNAEAASGEVSKIIREIENLEKQATESKKQAEIAEKAKTEAEHTLTGLTAQLQARQADVPPEFTTLQDLKKALILANHKIEGMDAVLKKALDAHTAVGQALAGAQAALAASENSAHQAQTTLDQQKAALREAAVSAGFATEAEYRSATLTDAAILELERQIKTFEQNLKSAQDRLARAEDAAQGLAAPDLPSLALAAKAASEALAEANTRQGEIQAQKKQIEKWLSGLGDTAKELARKQARYAVVGRLADAAGGDNPLRMSFHRFVLAALLDEVLAAASQRLRIMSHSRYQLYRSAETADLRRAGGLELEVFDEYTGKARPVATLSGGEGFLASLSLALGLADVVQAQAGGIHLETIFIDEGFGSLDAEALDLAVRALIDLQKGGRLVGLISHVPELKERIDTRLEITTSRSGSAARFVLGG